MDFSTLECLCIEVIAKDFDRYFSVFNTEQGHFKRQFEFLQRVYSYQILEKLEWLDNLKEIYIEALVNKYIKVVHTNWFKDVPWEIVTAKFAEVGSNIQKMFFYELKGAKPWRNIIHYIINVEVMIFCCGCNDGILKCIAQFCPNIMKINARFSAITNDGLKYLCKKENGKHSCPTLKEILISDSGVDDEGVKYLIKHLPSLEETDYHGLPRVIVYSQSENYGKVESYNLTSLDMLPFDFNDTDFSICLTLCPRLKSLSCSVRKEEQLDLFPYELKILKLECFLNSKININNFFKVKGRSLSFLKLSDCFLSVRNLAKNCPCLETLILQKVSFENDDNSPVFHHLERCIFEDIANESTTAKSISLLLTSSPQLECITFQRCDLSSSNLKSEILRSCNSFLIKRVIFHTSAVGMDFAKEFLKHCHLHLFQLRKCDVTKKDIVDFLRFAQTLPNNRIVLNDIDEDDKVDFIAFLNYDIVIFSFDKCFF